jgi:hypothetical protein
MTEGSEKARENKLRRAAARQGLVLSKSKVRDPLALVYGWHIRKGRREVAHFRDLAGAERWITDPSSREQVS